MLRVRLRELLSISMTCLVGTGALAETSPAEVIGSAVGLATAWPSDMMNLPAYRGEVDAAAIVTLKHLQIMGLELDDPWYGAAGVDSPLRSPDRYDLNCKRVGADFLAYVRKGVAEGAVPLGVLYVFSNTSERDVLAKLIPETAEAAMVCEHVYRVDGNEVAAARESVQKSLGQWFANIDVQPHQEAIRDFVSSGWTGDPANGIALMEVSVADEIMVPGKVDIFITSYSWLLPPDS